jgi:lipopolysaccharide export system protein LptC
VFETGPTEMKTTITPTLEHWKADADLAGMRDEKELTKLSEEERVAFKQLWNDVDQLLTKATLNK